MALFDFANPKDEHKFLRQLDKNFFNEEIALDPFQRYMGDKGSMIVAKKHIQKGTGTEVVFSLTYNPKVNEVYDEETLKGKGTLETPVNDSMNVGRARFAVGAKGFDLDQYTTLFDFYKAVEDQIRIKRELLIKSKNINQFAWCFAEGSRGKYHHKRKDYILGLNEVTSEFEAYFTPKIKECTINQLNASGDGISSDRVLFGGEPLGNVIDAGQTIVERCVVGNPAVGSANIGTVAIGDNTGRCSLKHLKNLIRIAKQGGRKLNMENAISPMHYDNFAGYRGFGYTYFVEPAVADSLLMDETVKQMLIRPFRETGQPTYFNGTDYIGTIFGTDIVVCDELSYLGFNNAAGNARIGYGVLAGSHAFAKAICGEVKYTREKDDHEDFYEVGCTIIDGMKPIKFPSKRYQNVNTFPKLEMGLVHSFTITD